MATLYLSANSRHDMKTKFLEILRDGIGPRYWVKPFQLEMIDSCNSIDVVILDKYRKQRAEGAYDSYEPCGWTKHRVPEQRYNIIIKNLRVVDWKSDPKDLPQNLGRAGVLFEW